MENASECACVNTGRDLSKTMRPALRIVVNIQVAYFLRILAQNVRTEQKVVADWLRRDQMERSRCHFSREGKVTEGVEGGFMNVWEMNLLEEVDDDKANNRIKEGRTYILRRMNR